MKERGDHTKFLAAMGSVADADTDELDRLL